MTMSKSKTPKNIFIEYQFLIPINMFKKLHELSDAMNLSFSAFVNSILIDYIIKIDELEEPDITAVYELESDKS